MDVEPEQVEATLARIKPQLEAQDFELNARLWSTLMLVMRLVRAQRASIARLRRLFGWPSSEKTREVTGAGASASAAADGATHADASDGTAAEKSKGHGRLGASDYPTALHHAVLHAELKVGAARCVSAASYTGSRSHRASCASSGSRCCVRTAGIASGSAAVPAVTCSRPKLRPKRRAPSSTRPRSP